MEGMEIKKMVRQGYGAIAKKSQSCCEAVSSCCGVTTAENISKNIGYKAEDLANLQVDANLGLGCGNPLAHASLKKGEMVLDLGSGAGIDCFLAAKEVGEAGKVIGVDMTPEMIDKARENAHKGDFHNVEFRLGEIENLPVADNSIDVIISNCVINLSPDKVSVFREAFRVLKPGGRLIVSDIVITRELPETIKKSTKAYIGCISGAILKNDYLNTINEAGFEKVEVLEAFSFPLDLMLNDSTAQAIIKDTKIPLEALKEMEVSIESIKVKGVKPL
jgi:SAM-dependent methyltransferase